MNRDQYIHLVQKMNEHNHSYYNLSDPQISDAEYDRLYQDLLSYEAAHPEHTVTYSPTQRIGAPLESYADKVVRNVRMPSLENSFTSEDYDAWAERLLGDGLAVELKLDGAGLELCYVYGHMVVAVSRGDGLTGENVTHVARAIKGIPLYISDIASVEKVEIRGEVVMPYTSLEKYRKAHPEKATLSPRNLASGAFRLLDPKKVALRGLVFIPHSLGEYPEGLFTDFKDFNTKCKRWGFRTISTQVCPDSSQIKSLYDRFVGYRDKLPFAVDGMVIKVNEFARHRIYGDAAKTPKWAIAWKFPEEEKETVVRKIQWQVGRTGVVTPVAIFDSVELSGVNVTNATLHNMDEIVRKGIMVGDTVVVSRAGDVIPKVVRVVLMKRNHYCSQVQPPTECPECSSALTKSGAHITCNSLSCRGRVVGRLIHFASRNAMNIVGLGESMADFLYNNAGVDSFYKILRLRDNAFFYQDSKTRINLLEAIDKAFCAVDPAKLLFAFGIPGIGEIQAEQIMRYITSKGHTIDDLIFTYALMEDLRVLDGISDSVIGSLRSFADNRDLLDDALRVINEVKYWKIPLVTTEGKFKGQVFTLTGTLSKPRKEVEAYIKENGGKVSSSVTQKTTLLIIGDNPGNDKIKAAAKYRTAIEKEEYLYL